MVGTARRKVFVVSLHRSGTQSVSDLLRRSGFNDCHFPGQVGAVDYQALCAGRELDRDFVVETMRPAFDSFDSVSDVPLPGLYDSLLKAYPDALYLAVTRRPFDWVRSVRRHLADRPFDTFEKVQYWRYIDGRPQTIGSISDHALLGMHFDHHAHLLRVMPENQFRLFDLGAKDLGEQICQFVGAEPVAIGDLDSMRNLHLLREMGLSGE